MKSNKDQLGQKSNAGQSQQGNLNRQQGGFKQPASGPTAGQTGTKTNIGPTHNAPAGKQSPFQQTDKTKGKDTYNKGKDTYK